MPCVISLQVPLALCHSKNDFQGYTKPFGSELQINSQVGDTKTKIPNQPFFSYKSNSSFNGEDVAYNIIFQEVHVAIMYTARQSW